jgi:hypothetical protein
MYKLMETIPQDGSFQLPIFSCLNATICQSFFLPLLTSVGQLLARVLVSGAKVLAGTQN